MVMYKYSFEVHREQKVFNMVEESLDALFQAEFEDDESLSMEELFSEALEKVEDARRRVDKMQKAGVSLFTPPCKKLMRRGSWRP